MDHYSRFFNDSRETAETKIKIREILVKYNSNRPVFKHERSSGMGDLLKRGAMGSLEENVHEIENAGVVVVSEVFNLQGPGGMAVYLLGFSQNNEVYGHWKKELEEMGFTKNKQRDLLAEIDEIGRRLSQKR